MKRNIISINEEKCVGCGLCVSGCHQGALQIVDGKAKLMSESYCDGLGKCLPACPTGALKVIEKEVDAFNESRRDINAPKTGFTCPSSRAKTFDRVETPKAEVKSESVKVTSQLGQWPCQIQLVPPNASYFDGAKLLIAADCTAFAYANFHDEFMRNKITIIGCPKLDEVQYAEKLTQIISMNNIKSVDVLRMSVPCCGGLENAVKQALINSGKMIPWQVTVISTDGQILDR